MTVNKAMLIGNLGKDPELRYSSKQVPICTFSIATTERTKDQSGNWTDHTEWHRIVCFGRTAENCSKYLSKGRQVYIEGRIRTNKWTDKNGVDRYTTEILADTVQFIGKKEAGSGRGDYSPAPGLEPEVEKPEMPDLPSADDLGGGATDGASIQEDDIPF